ncbi:unnamed protein product [Malus baccata var. baccata]
MIKLIISATALRNRTVQDLPAAVGDAVASLIFAASRYGELPELILLGGLFKEQCGRELDIISVELRPGNRVNSQLMEKLCITLIPMIIIALQTKISSMSRKLMGFNNKFRNSETEKKSPGIRCSLSKGKLSLATPTHSQNGSNSTAGSVGSTKNQDTCSSRY